MMRVYEYVVTLKDSDGLKGRRYHVTARNRESAIAQVMTTERFAPRSAIKSVVRRKKRGRHRRTR